MPTYSYENKLACLSCQAKLFKYLDVQPISPFTRVKMYLIQDALRNEILPGSSFWHLIAGGVLGTALKTIRQVVNIPLE